MTIITILMAIVNAALFFLYGKEHKRRIALEGEVKSFADKKAYDINELLSDNARSLKPISKGDVFIGHPHEKPKAMTAPIVKSAAHPPKPIPPELNVPKIPRGYKRNNGLKKWPLKPTDIIDILFRDGQIWKEETVRGWDWKHQYGGSDIIAYKVVKPKTMNRKKK